MSYTSRLIQTTHPAHSPLTIHILESGSPTQPLLILLHGFPELSFSWRKVLPALATAGYHVVAPDQRGFGRTTGWDARGYSEADLHSFTASSLVRDVVGLVQALGHEKALSVVGHDCGAVTAAMCAVMRPDLFQSVVLLSHPFNGLKMSSSKEKKEDVHAELAALGRKHYKWYYSGSGADADMRNPPQGLHEFLRGYFYLKSGEWAGNRAARTLGGWTAQELAQLPSYYVMPLQSSMPDAVAGQMKDEKGSDVDRSKRWLSDEELSVYVENYERTGFQGALNWYRVRTAGGGRYADDCEVFAGRKIDVPCAFVSGKLDWGVYQEPGAIEKMVDGTVCSDFRGLRLVDGVGHWAPQECPEVVCEVVLGLVGSL